MAGYDVVVEIETRLGEALDRWSRLEAHGVASAFQTTAYLTAWFDAFGRAPGCQPVFVFVRVGGEDAIGLPLVRERGRWLARIGFADDRIGDYAVAMVDRGRRDLPDFDRLWPLILASLPPSSYVELLKIPALPWLPGPDLTSIPNLERLSASAHPVPIPDNGRDPADSILAARTRADLRRRRRRLEELGSVKFRVAADRGEALRWCERMIRYRLDRFAAIGRRDDLSDERFRRFLVDLCSRGVGLAVVSALLLNDEPVAIQYGLLHERRYYQIVTSFRDGPWSVLAPGRLLMLETLRWCAGRGVGIYDFTYGNEPYKADFGALELPLMRYVRARSFWGHCFLAATAGRRHAVAVLNRVAAWFGVS
jgi:CelD/BcsL family acetyltransferase involved in cellulose biosynthesis